MTVSDALASTAAPYTPPSQVAGYRKQAWGVAYQAVGLVSNDWKYAGKEMYEDGKKEVDKARYTAKGDATVGGLRGAGQSALGMWTNSKPKLDEGAIRTHDAEWEGALADHTIPKQSVERVEAKAEGYCGMKHGDFEKEKDGIMRAGKAAWKE